LGFGAGMADPVEEGAAALCSMAALAVVTPGGKGR
jgi:hypothetical protein